MAAALACSPDQPPPRKDSIPAFAIASDTSEGEVLIAVPATGDAGRPVTAPNGDFRDTGVVIPTTAELDELRRAMIVPVQGVVVADLRDTYTDARGVRVHHAMDIHAARGTAVLSATDGKLLALHTSTAGGLMVYAADASDRFILMYAHLDRYAGGLSEGMRLRQGQVIGYVGTTGNAPPNTPHLHFAIARGRPSRSWWKGTPVNPFVVFGGASRAAALDAANDPLHIRAPR